MTEQETSAILEIARNRSWQIETIVDNGDGLRHIEIAKTFSRGAFRLTLSIVCETCSDVFKFLNEYNNGFNYEEAAIKEYEKRCKYGVITLIDIAYDCKEAKSDLEKLIEDYRKSLDEYIPSDNMLNHLQAYEEYNVVLWNDEGINDELGLGENEGLRYDCTEMKFSDMLIQVISFARKYEMTFSIKMAKPNECQSKIDFHVNGKHFGLTFVMVNNKENNKVMKDVCDNTELDEYTTGLYIKE